MKAKNTISGKAAMYLDASIVNFTDEVLQHLVERHTTPLVRKKHVMIKMSTPQANIHTIRFSLYHVPCHNVLGGQLHNKETVANATVNLCNSDTLVEPSFPETLNI